MVRTLSSVSRLVANIPISCTVPATPPALTKSPVLNGLKITRKTPAAKLPSMPPHATPMPTPAAGGMARNGGACPREGRERLVFHAGDAEDGDHQDDVQHDRHGGDDVAPEGGIQTRAHQPAVDE